MPYHSISDLIDVCNKTPKNVIFIGRASKDASLYFNLRTETEIKEFIGNDGLENLVHQNTKEWELNPTPNIPIYVDAYEFSSNYKRGYIAFMFNNQTKKWIIKSFKLSENRSTSLEDAFKNAGFIR